MKAKGFRAAGLLLPLLAVLLFCAPARAMYTPGPLWGTSAMDEFTGSRSSTAWGGVTGNASWDCGGFSIAWDITEDAGRWTYRYEVDVVRKDVSHFILEVTDDVPQFNIFEGTDTDIEGPQTWTEGPSNPDMPNDIYGVKFDFGGTTTTYTIVTDRAPVYGVFYARDGKDQGEKVTAWSDALAHSDYRTNACLDQTAFIVRPDSMGDVPPGAVPLPGAMWLLGSGLLGLARFRRSA